MLGTELQGYKMIQPIETVYKGYKFRSRLEARWAVFFDKLGIEWEYEPEGFDLGNGVYYLPDFYLPSFKCYVEIKPLEGFDEKTASEKLEHLFDKGDCVVMLCKGDPVDEDIQIYCNFTNYSGSGTDWYECWFFKKPYADGFCPIGLIVNGWCDDLDYFTGDGGSLNNIFSFTQYKREYFKKMSQREADFIENAELAARQARFEYGETP